jgi:hypothetical protein
MVRNVNPRRFNIAEILQDHENRITQLEHELFRRGQWAPYSPTLTNVTVGNGTLTARWCRVRDFVQVKLIFQFGSTSAFTGTIGFGTPVDGFSTSGFVYPMGTAIARPSGATGSNVFKGFTTNDGSGAITEIRIVAANGTNAGGWNASTPFVWSDGAILGIDATYEAGA